MGEATTRRWSPPELWDDPVADVLDLPPQEPPTQPATPTVSICTASHGLAGGMLTPAAAHGMRPERSTGGWSEGPRRSGSLLLQRKAKRKSTLHSGPQGAELIERNCNEEVLAVMAACPQDRACADCAAELGSDAWASVNLGIFLCIRCCGVHRSLGTHISQCRSVDLDKWSPEQVRGMRGNRASNAVYEAYMPPGRSRPSPCDPLALCADWLRAKYIRREFTVPHELPVTLESYSLGTCKVQVMRPGRSPKAQCGPRKQHVELEVAQARISDGVVLVEVPGWGSTRLFVAMDSTMQAVSKQHSHASVPQDRPLDSKAVRILGQDGEPLLEFATSTMQEAVAWLKALRGSAALGSRSSSFSGWLTRPGRTLRRPQRRFYLLHPSGLYCFRSDAVSAQLPEAATLGAEWKGVIHKSAVQGLDFGGSVHEPWLALRTGAACTHVLLADEPSHRDVWVEALSRWAGIRASDMAEEKVPVCSYSSDLDTE